MIEKQVILGLSRGLCGREALRFVQTAKQFEATTQIVQKKK